MTALDLVYQYRAMLGKCEAGVGLEMDEVIELTALEAVFATEATLPRRERSEMTCVLRGAGRGDGRGEAINDRVRIGELTPGGLVCRQAPYVEEGDVVEVVIDDEAAHLSYRFKARVSWLREDVGDDFALGLAFVGTPLLVHYGASEHVEDAVDRIAAAA